jgi:hypothetical protein
MLKNSSGVRIDILPVAAKSFLLRVIKYLHFPLIAELSCMASSKSLISLLNDLFSISGFRVIIENPFIIDFVTIFASDSDRFFSVKNQSIGTLSAEMRPEMLPLFTISINRSEDSIPVRLSSTSIKIFTSTKIVSSSLFEKPMPYCISD